MSDQYVTLWCTKCKAPWQYFVTEEGKDRQLARIEGQDFCCKDGVLTIATPEAQGQ